MNSISKTALLFLITLIATISISLAIRPDQSKPTSSGGGGKGNRNDPGSDGFFGPGSGFGVPGFNQGSGWGNGIIGGGYGSGYGGPNGGRSKHGVTLPTVVCKVKGPCYMKKLTCPAKCFHSYSRSGKGYGGGGGGGGCTMDCKKKCVAFC